MSDALTAFDWTEVASGLDQRGWATLPELASPAACGEISGLYTDPAHFRTRIVMARYGFGRGEYQYFAYPLPPPIAAWRTALYAHLSPVANAWHERLGIPER